MRKFNFLKPKKARKLLWIGLALLFFGLFVKITWELPGPLQNDSFTVTLEDTDGDSIVKTISVSPNDEDAEYDLED